MADGANGARNSGNNWTSNSMGNNWTSNSNWTSNGVGNGGGNNVREDSLAVVGDLSDVSINVVSVVVDVLDPSVGQVDRVVSLPGSGAVVSLGSIKAGSRVVVSHGILVGVGGDLVGVDLSNGMGNWVSNSMTNNSVANAVTNMSMSKRVSDRSN